MNKSILFIIHGMGVHDDEGEWAKPAVNVLQRAFNKYRHPKRTYSMRDRIEIIPISYDHIFRKTVESWQQNSKQFTKAATGLDGIEIAGLVNWLDDAGVQENNKRWTHAADVALYRGYSLIRDEIKSHIANEIGRRVIDLEASQSWGVIAHSLGTIVAHDSLHMLWSGKVPVAVEQPLSPRHNKAQFVAMVSNVSRLLQTDVDVYDSTVAPGASNSTQFGCHTYMNINHELDPFSVPRRFRPPDLFNRGADMDKRYLDIKPRHIHDRNIHSLEHYLLNPEVHIPILCGLMFRTYVSQDERKQALDEFPLISSNGRDLGLAFQEKIVEKLPAESDVWPILRKVWDRFADDLLSQTA